MRKVLIFLAVLALGACETLSVPDEPVGGPGDAARGLRLVQAHCASCHGLGTATTSPYAGAPTFRSIAAKGGIEDMAEAFAEGIIVPHKGQTVMPEFVLNPQEIEDLIAYINSLK